MDMELTIEELAQRAGVPVRTVRYYIAEGILPSAGARGRNATYGEEHLAKLLLARRLADRRVLLIDIRDQVSRLTPAEAQALLRREEASDQALQRTKPESARAFISALLDQAQHPVESQARAQAPLPGAEPHVLYSSPRPEPNQTWRRVELGPGVELHIRSDAETQQAALIRRLLRQAGHR